jgi:lysophospholipase L1-like esterase
MAGLKGSELLSESDGGACAPRPPAEASAQDEENAMKALDVKRAIELGVAAVGLLMAGAATFASDNGAAPEEALPYLALGDSLAFGFITQAGFEYLNAKNFLGYPAYVGAALHLKTVNSACPGETSGSFISASVADEGCRSFRASAPLHVAYTGTQLAFATTFLQTHPETRLVTIALGANDLILLQDACASSPDPTTCIQSGLAPVLAGVSSNMDTILRGLRATGFSGPLIVVSYYSPDYTDALVTEATAALNQTVAAVASVHGARVADGFSAFQHAASNPFAGGRTCVTGLLNASPQNQNLCDKHASQSGHQLLAHIVEAAIE